MKRIPTILAASAIALSGASASAAVFDFDIVVEFTDDFLSFDAASDYDFAADFASAVSTWTGIFSGRHAANERDAVLTITADLPTIDGVGGTLGQAGPQNLICSDGTFDAACTSSQFDDRYVIGRGGVMEFDSADAQNLANNGLFEDVVLHEMAHVMGFGTLWELNDLYLNESGQYLGVNGLAAFQDESGRADAEFIPVDIRATSGPGTRNGHWDEDFLDPEGVENPRSNGINSGNPDDGFTPGFQGRNEIMTGFLDPNGTYISQTTIQSFVDLGYVVAEGDLNAIPLPAGGWLILTALGGLALARRRKAA